MATGAATGETNKPLLLSAMLGSKDEVDVMRFFSMTDFYRDIRVEVELEGASS
jgi:hypothetical protein